MSTFIEAEKLADLEQRLQFLEAEVRKIILKNYIKNSVQEIQEYLKNDKLDFIDGMCEAISTQITNSLRKEQEGEKTIKSCFFKDLGKST